jgi:hypothetical protein
LIKVAVTNLLQDVGISGFIDLESFVAMRADDLAHAYFSPFFIRIHLLSGQSNWTVASLVSSEEMLSALLDPFLPHPPPLHDLISLDETDAI